MRTALVILIGCCFITANANSKNWPQWRGPNGNGLYTDGVPPLKWSEDKNVRWKTAIPGQGHATPVIWEDKIFVLSAVETGRTIEPPEPQAQPENEGRGRRRGGRGRAPTTEYAYTTLCVDRVTGKILWEKAGRVAVPHQGIQGSNTYGSASPVTDGERVYSSFGSEGLFCYDMDGNLVWQKDLGKVNVTFGEGTSPTVHGDMLLVLQDNNGESFLYALDKRTGKEIWKTQRDESSGWTTPSVFNQDGQLQVVVTGSNAVRGYDIKTGDLIWQCSGLGSNPVPSLVADDSVIVAMSGHRNGAAIAIQRGGKGDLTGTDAVRWTITRGTPYVPSPLLYDGLLFFCQRNDPMLSCVDVKSGEAHYSQERIEGIGGIYASMVGAGDRIYIPSQSGATLVLAKAKEPKVLAINELSESIDASPALYGNQLFLRGHEHLYCIEEE